MSKKFGNVFYACISTVLIFQLMGCGTILYPERKGQRSGRIDVGVALLDGIGLFFFLIPGIIAYAVDFNNGTIYLPNGLISMNLKDMKQVKFDQKHSSIENIEGIVKDETGYDVKQFESTLQIVELKSSNDMLLHFAEALPEIQNTQMVYLNK